MWEWLKRNWFLADDAAPASAPVAAPEEPRPGHRVIDIVFHGPGFAGKTTNMQWIYQRTAPEAKDRMVSLATETDRCLYCQIYPRTVAHPSGEPLCVRLSSVPGPVFYDESRVRILRSADGVIFVADSQVDRTEANLESLETLDNALEANGVHGGRVPRVFQYNKRDLPGLMPVEEMEAQLNPRAASHFAAVASRGEGVFPTLKECVRLVLLRAAESGPT
ncbi:MAG: GTPase domain-containing protein [Polyangiales bacterium]